MDSLYEIASQMEVTGQWRLSLTEDEHLIFTDFLGVKERWTKFINLEDVTCGVPCTKEALQMVAVRSRAMLFESFLSKIYPLGPEFEESFEFINDPPRTQSQESQVNGNGTAGTSSPPLMTVETLYSADALEKALSDRKLPLDDMYYTLEFGGADDSDVPEPVATSASSSRVAIDRPEDKAEEKPEEKKPVLPPPPKRARKYEEPPDFVIQAGMKHLWETVQDFNYEQSTEVVSVRDLKALVAGSNPVKSKWYHEYRYGQDVLYDACEKVLNLLINFKEHSKPFLQKVQKRDVPDYYDIITEPMDLGTMSKKLKAHKYNSKKEFLDDLALIYDNCRKYNGTNIENPYTMHAVAMEKRTEKLAPTIPDITIRDLLDPKFQNVPLTPLGLDFEDHLEGSHTPPSQDSPQKTAPSQPMDVVELDLQPKINGHPQTKETTPSLPMETQPNGESLHSHSQWDSWEAEKSDMSASAVNGLHIDQTLDAPTPAYKAPPPVVLQDEYTFGGIVNRETDIRAIAWQEEYLTPELKKRKRSRREMEFGESPALIRTPAGMSLFIQHHTPGKSKSNLGNYFPELHPMSSVPYLNSNRETIPKRNSNSLETTSNLENHPIVRNIETQNRIRLLRSKIEGELSGKSVNEEPSSASSETQEESLKLRLKPLCPSSVLNEETARSAAGKANTLLFAHAGFEGISPLCNNVVTDLLARHLQNFGRVMTEYNASQLPNLSQEEILARSLRQMGVNKLDYLEEYWKLDVLHFGYKLDDIERKLGRKYRELSIGGFDGMEGYDGWSDSEIEGDVAFISGNFGDDVDVDYFGFKELGLDGIRVPNHLIAPGVKSKFVRDRLAALASKKGAEAATDQGFTNPPPFPPIVPQEQIGLLKDFFVKLAAQEDGIIEDDQLSSQKRNERKIASSETDLAEFEEAERENKNAKKALAKPPPKKKATKKPDEP